MVTGKITIGPEIDLTAETGTRIIIEAEETTTTEVAIEITDPTIGITVGPVIETTTEMVVGTIIDQIIEEMTVTKGMVTEIRTVVGPEREIEIGETGVAQEKVPNPGVVVDPINRNESRRQSRSNARNRDRSESRSRSSSCVSTNRDRCRCYQCNEYDHFARECPNDATGGNSDDA